MTVRDVRWQAEQKKLEPTFGRGVILSAVLLPTILTTPGRVVSQVELNERASLSSTNTQLFANNFYRGGSFRYSRIFTSIFVFEMLLMVIKTQALKGGPIFRGHTSVAFRNFDLDAYLFTSWFKVVYNLQGFHHCLHADFNSKQTRKWRREV